MNNATDSTALPSQIGDLFKDKKHYIDNIFADTWKSLKVNSQLATAGFSRRSGTRVEEVVFLLTSRTALRRDPCPILRMKKDQRNWNKVPGLPWRAVSLEVELNLAVARKDPPEWRKVQLLFVRGLKEADEADVSKKDWALFFDD